MKYLESKGIVFILMIFLLLNSFILFGIMTNINQTPTGQAATNTVQGTITLTVAMPSYNETCDGIDNDNNSIIDDGCDDDNDDYCDANMTVYGTPAVCPFGEGDCDDDPSDDPTGCPLNYTECNSSTGACAICINPGASEIPCDGIDQNCNAYWQNVSFNDQLLVKREHIHSQKSKFYNWSGSKWVLDGYYNHDSLTINNNEIGLADWDNDSEDELILKVKTPSTAKTSKFYEWDGDSWLLYKEVTDDNLRLYGNKEVAACDILDNDGIPELIVKREGFKKETYFYHWISDSWQLVSSSTSDTVFLRGGDIACGDYDNDSINELIVKKKHKDKFNVYTWSGSEWNLESIYYNDDLTTGYSEIAMGNTQGTKPIWINPDDRIDSDGDGIDDCEDACPNIYGTLYKGCPAAITTSANLFKLWWHKIIAKEPRVGQEVDVYELSCANQVLNTSFPDTPSWENLTSETFTHKEAELNAIRSNCSARICEVDDSGSCTVGVENNDYIVFGPFEAEIWLPPYKIHCYSNDCMDDDCDDDDWEGGCRGNKRHKYCSNNCNINWLVNTEEYAYAVYRPPITVSNSNEYAYLDYIKLWWDRLVPAVFKGTIVGSELDIILHEYLIEIPEGETPPPEYNASGPVEYISPLLFRADTSWDVNISLGLPEDYVPVTTTQASIDEPIDLLTIGIEHQESSGGSGAAVAQPSNLKSNFNMKIQAKHPYEAEWKNQTIEIDTQPEPKPKKTIIQKIKTVSKQLPIQFQVSMMLSFGLLTTALLLMIYNRKSSN